MTRKISKLFGSRVALRLVEEEYEGLLVPAADQFKTHVISEVLAVGDKVETIKVGDVVFWQTNAQINSHCRYSLNGTPVFVMMAGDMIASLEGKLRTVKLDTFHVIGDWCLAKRVVEQSKTIYLPEEVIEANQELVVHYVLEQKGGTVNLEIEKGQELLVDRTRANPIQLGEDRFCYIHKNFVLGTVE